MRSSRSRANHQLKQELDVIYGDIYMRKHERFLDKSVEYGQQISKGLFITHGGALIALLAFVGSHEGDGLTAAPQLAKALAEPFWYFAVGLILAVGVAVMGYFNFSILSASTAPIREIVDHVVHQVNVREYGNANHAVWVEATLYLGIAAAFGSMVLFLVGVNSAIEAFTTS